VLVGLGYPDAFAAADHVPGILEFRPIGLEGFEGSMVDGLRKKGAQHLDLVPEGRGYLLVEFGFEEAEETDQTAERFAEWAKQLPGGPDVRRYSNAQARAMWRIREAGPRAATRRLARRSMGGMGRRVGRPAGELSARSAARLDEYDANGVLRPLGMAAFTCG
jgi:hypothetical protein